MKIYCWPIIPCFVRCLKETLSFDKRGPLSSLIINIAAIHELMTNSIAIKYKIIQLFSMFDHRNCKQTFITTGNL